MTEPNKPNETRTEKRLTKKQALLAEAKLMHDDWLEDGGSLDLISDMGCRNHALALAVKLENPGLADLAAQVTQHRVQVGLKPLDPFKLMLDGTLVERAKESEEEVEDQIIANRAAAEKARLKKSRRAAGGISAR